MNINKLTFFVFLMGLSGFTWSADITTRITYLSSVTQDNEGPLDLRAEINYNDAVADAPIAVVMHGFSPTMGNFDNIRINVERLRDLGFFVISVAMRGRDGSDGVRDSSGIEIYDIYDAVEYVKQNYPSFVDETNIHITGYSGGGGNTMAALVKFPDYFRAGSAFYGMSDYGFHPTDGWYQNGASNNHKSILDTDIGNPTLNDPDIQDRYHARAAYLASGNNPYSEIHLFVNNDETISPPVNSEKFRDNAGAANITVHIGEQGLMINGDEQYWPHGFPTADEQAAGENWYIDRLLDGSISEPQLAKQADLTVIGFVKTKPFLFWLGDGQNAAAVLGYFIDNSNKIFRLREILSNDKTVAGDLTVDTADMNGQNVTVKLNDTVVENFSGGGLYTYEGLKVGDKLELVTDGSGGGGDRLFSDQFEGPPGNGGGNGGDGWDLVVEQVILNDTKLAPNQNFTVTATVKNIGNEASPDNSVPADTVKLRVFLSKDAVPELNELIDDDNIENSLAPNESIEQCANVTAFGGGAAGDYLTIVCVVTAPGEADSDNNCADGIPTTIDVSESRTDQLCD